MVQVWKVLHEGGTQMPFIHLAEIFQGLTSDKLVGVGQEGSCSSNTPRLHL
jgi:hypothetical protein